MQDKVVYCGIALAAGTRHELPTESGMAHFCEHMSFKGTPRLSSVQISRRIESVGAEINAFTGKEETVYYVACLQSHLRRALPLLQDIVFHSTYPQTEIDKEVEVVLDEIESYKDSPADLIYDDFEGLLYARHPLGRNILGEPSRLRQYTTANFLRYVHRTYRPDQALLFVMGSPVKPHAEGEWQVAGEGDFWYRWCAPRPQSSILAPEAAAVASVPPEPSMANPSTVTTGAFHQAHVIMGARGFGMGDPRHLGLCLLSNLLGGPAMSSRLNLSLRERRGLCYTVESSVAAYTDTSTWTVYFGCDKGDVGRCQRLVRSELSHLTDKPLSPRALSAAKRQFFGQMAITHEQRESVALGIAKRLLHTGHAMQLHEMMEQIDAFTPFQLQEIALQVMNPDRLTTLTYLPLD